jgi:fermentation-respiration switch protein FrsA (DUF1100 family)
MLVLKWLLIVAVAGYIVVVALMYLFQRSLMYFPDTTRTPPAAAGLPQAQEIQLTAADGTRLIAWFVAPAPGRPLVLYFHGNAGALNLRAERFGKLVAPGNGLLAVSWRGYGGSGGSPSEVGLIADARVAYDDAVARVPADRIVVFGESLGTAVAVALAAQHKVAGVILDAPFTAAADVAASIYRFVPVRWLMTDQFNSAARIGKVEAPLLVLHGERDTIVPIAFGEKLFALAREPKRMVRFPDGGHVNLDSHGAMPEILRFLDARVAP